LRTSEKRERERERWREKLNYPTFVTKQQLVLPNVEAEWLAIGRSRVQKLGLETGYPV
jgi:hypothetical protein